MIDLLIRKYLIDTARRGLTIHYSQLNALCNLGLNLANQQEKQILAEKLGDISIFEFQNERPLLSSIVISKGTNRPGGGFYVLAESLEFGERDELKQSHFEEKAIKETIDFWKDKNNYNSFKEIEGKESVFEHNISFFNKDELEFFAIWAGRVFDKDDVEHQAARDYIKSTAWVKTIYWAEKVVEQLPEYRLEYKRVWNKRDWHEGKRVSIIRGYTWVKIYKNQDFDKEIYFTLGVDALNKSLVYKIDYAHNSQILSEQQKAICNSSIPEEINWNEITIDELKDWNWSELIRETVGEVSRNTRSYDELINKVWGVNRPLTSGSPLIENSTPVFYSTENETSNNTFLFPVTDVDFETSNKRNKEIGDLGEELVMKHEVNKLKILGLINLIDQVKIMPDGSPFDILSFDELGKELFIEVKTTLGDINVPFFISANELNFYNYNAGKLLIYRIYNLNEELLTGEFYIVRNLNENYKLESHIYKVTPL